MAKILITDGISKSAAKKLIEKGHDLTQEFFELDELKKQLELHEVVIVRSATKIRKEAIDSAAKTGNLKLIIRAGVGLDNIDVSYAQEKGIEVKNTPAASSLAVAELTIGHIIAVARNIYIANVTMRDGKWEKKKYKGVEINGKTLGLIGFGRIAKETARLASALGMKVIYYTRSGKKQGFDNFEYISLDELYKRSDFISLHIPFVKEAGPTLAEKEFDKMKDGVYIINCARGGVVSEKDLINAIRSGKVAAAAVDVYEEEPTQNVELTTCDKISLTPHIGAITKEAQEKIGDIIIDIIDEKFGS